MDTTCWRYASKVPRKSSTTLDMHSQLFFCQALPPSKSFERSLPRYSKNALFLVYIYLYTFSFLKKCANTDYARRFTSIFQLVQRVSAVAGLSLGEYTALVFAGALSFEQGLRVVKVRAESMADTAQMGEPHGMLSIIGLGDGEIEAICSQVRSEMPYINQTPTVCQLANYLFPQVWSFPFISPPLDHLDSATVFHSNLLPVLRSLHSFRGELYLVTRWPWTSSRERLPPRALSSSLPLPFQVPFTRTS